MRIAFYAPLKPPDHPTPSGDRQVAQLLLEALRLGGHTPFIAARFRSYDATGDLDRQARLRAIGERLAARLLRRWRRQPGTAPDLWFTYHLYYKAPDWLGPIVSRALGIPYVVAEASLAAKRAEGGWRFGHCGVETALRHADLVLGLNPADRAAVVPLLAAPCRYRSLPPFLDAHAYRMRRAARDVPRLISVAMMRPGDKLASYRLLGEALASLRELPWSLDIVGDGPARPAVEAALMPLGARVRYRGALDRLAVAGALAEAELMVWPAINEAFGMALLEAQASGVPVVAGDSSGVGAIVAHGHTGLLVPSGDVAGFAAAVRRLLCDPAACAAMGAAARKKVRREHDLPVAASRLAATLDAVCRVRAA
ncbi:MAG: glycosyltransferase family 4 protein [Thiohalocapsa sp.]